MDQSLKTGPKDVFLHLLAIVTLYASAVSFTALVFQFINLAFPNIPNDGYFYADGFRHAIRTAVSALIVVFPVYFFVSRMLRKMYEADAARKNLGIRKWLSYFTLFLAAGIAIGWLVSVVNNFLEGDFTTAFILKALTIFFVTGSAFYYYRAVTLGKEADSSVKYYGYFVAVVVAAAIIGAFVMVGSPKTQRLRQFDDRRVNDLQLIQNQIANYYQAKNKLPTKLEDMNDALRGITIPKDPSTGKDYEYKVSGENSFDLCAEFALPSDGKTSLARPSMAEPYYGPYGDNWKHDAGRACFNRTIDKDYFPPLKGV